MEKNKDLYGPTLWLIPARGGSKGIPDKNLKPFCGVSLVSRTVKQAIECADTSDTVFVSTDSEAIKKEVEKNDIEVPFLRPAKLATDSSSTYSVIMHSLESFKILGKEFEKVVLLQPTSPLRIVKDIRDAYELWNPGIDMVVSVSQSRANPYYNLFETDKDGFLKISKGPGNYTRRQDVPKVWEYNGAVYVMTTNSLLKEPLSCFKKVLPYEMPASRSIDLDTPDDWIIAELLFQRSNPSK
ncbi:MAG: acylneuraminate cytidylyltransferase family protein [Muribaculaceae bacterium]|nr:acylneuraminate cytidylyltransferase family protein [Muribaculaceae bacterium]